MINNPEKFSLNIPASDKPRIVVIGGGFGGINVIKRLKSSDFQMVLLDRYNYHTFQPLLYQVATAGLEPDSIAGPLRKVIKKDSDFYFRMIKVKAIDPDRKILQTSAGKLSYDYLVIATGSRINYYGHDGIAEHAFPIKQIPHALDLRSHIFQQFEKQEMLQDDRLKKMHMTFVVVGAGPTGVEVCGALAELKRHVLPKDYPELKMSDMQIYLIEALDRVLPSMSHQSGEKVHQYLERLNIEIILNCMTKGYDGQTVKLSNNREIVTGTLIWAAGVKGNLIEGLDTEGLQKGKILVNGVNQVYRNYKTREIYGNIYAIGDVAQVKTANYPEGLPGLAPVAIQQGKHLARNLTRLRNGRGLVDFLYKNKGLMATIGRNKAVADLPGHLRLGGIAGWFVWMFVHLLYLVGFRNKTVVFANWIWNYLTYDRGIRLIIRPSTKLNDAISQEMIREMDESKM